MGWYKCNLPACATVWVGFCSDCRKSCTPCRQLLDLHQSFVAARPATCLHSACYNPVRISWQCTVHTAVIYTLVQTSLLHPAPHHAHIAEHMSSQQARLPSISLTTIKLHTAPCRSTSKAPSPQSRNIQQHSVERPAFSLQELPQATPA